MRVNEARRAIGRGHKGVIFPASPMELRDVPHINEPVYDPLWGACEETRLCRSASTPELLPEFRCRPGETFSPALAAAFRDMVRSVSSIAVFANFLFSRILYRFPKLKIVFAESSLGWGAYEIEYADYQSEADGLQREGYDLKPSELFQRQCYFTCWYDRMSLKVRRYLGAGNILVVESFSDGDIELARTPGRISKKRLPIFRKRRSGRSCGRTQRNCTDSKRTRVME